MIIEFEGEEIELSEEVSKKVLAMLDNAVPCNE